MVQAANNLWEVCPGETPTGTETTARLSHDLVLVFDLREIVLRPPAEGDPSNLIYRNGIWHEGVSVQDTLTSLDVCVGRIAARLVATIRAGDLPAAEDAEGLEPRLRRIDAGIGCADTDYWNLEPHGNDISSILRVLGGGSIDDFPRPEDPATVGAPSSD